MGRRYWMVSGAVSLAAFAILLAALAAAQPVQRVQGPAPQETEKGSAPEGLPKIPRPDANAAQVPSGYRVEVVLANLTYPTSIEFDDAGAMYIAEGGYIYGDEIAPARILRVPPKGEAEVVADQLSAPITDLLWHGNRLYISHRGKISILESGSIRDLVTGLPSQGDHHNNQMTIGPDGKLYFGQGVATNSGVVGLDSFKMGWLAKYPDVHDAPAKDIRVTDQAFETPDPLAIFADKGKGHDGQGHEGHGAKGEATSKGHEGHGTKGEVAGKDTGHEEHDAKAKGQEKDKGHEGHGQAKGTEQGKKPEGQEKGKDAQKGQGHEGHGAKGKDAEKGKEHEGHGTAKGPEKGEGHEGHRMVKTFAFQPFGKTPPDNGALRGTTKASGTILRMNLDGSNLEVYAWGLRNPFGVLWGPDKELYASDNGYDERGSRPIAHAPDCLWRIKQGAWYGFPDYAGGIPVTDARFRPEHGPAPKFLLRDHPPVEKPVLALTHHVGASKMDFSRNATFGFKGHLFLALVGDMNPITGAHEERSGFEVARIDPESRKAETFFKAKKSALGPKGMEYVATAGPRRPVDVQFSPDGNALYVVDVGALAIVPTAAGPAPRPFPRTGVVWRITRAGNPNQ
jgi:glucose/arabinose dehydrogenase